MMDEYERALEEFSGVVRSVSPQEYERLRDPNTLDENCRSIQTIFSHVVSSGYSYADYLRNHFHMESSRPAERLLSYDEAMDQLHRMKNYTIETLDGRWEMPEEDIMKVVIQSRWGQSYDMEQLMEHAIVHILRHRRQINKFLSR